MIFPFVSFLFWVSPMKEKSKEYKINESTSELDFM